MADIRSQSVFGGLGKKKKKKRKIKETRHQNPLSSGSERDDPPSPQPKKSFEHPDVSQCDIRFVLPRVSKHPSVQLVPFLFPRQRQQLAIKKPRPDEATQQDQVTFKQRGRSHIEESIEDVLFPGKKWKSSKNESLSKEHLTPLSEGKLQVDSLLANGEVEIKAPKQFKTHTPYDDAEEKTNSSESGVSGVAISHIRPMENDKGKNEYKSRQTSTVDDFVSKNDKFHKDLLVNSSKILARSVEDAINDRDGRRPRANSTDGELNLPQHGLCDERIVLQSHIWNMKLLYDKNSSAIHSPPPPRGFINLGNSCFLNATLQCLVYMPSFCQCITALPSSCYETKGGGRKLHGQRITMILRSLLRTAHGITALEKNDVPKSGPIAPNAIFNAITSCKTNGHRFRPGRQEDAHELLVHLLDAMHEGELFAAGKMFHFLIFL